MLGFTWLGHLNINMFDISPTIHNHSTSSSQNETRLSLSLPVQSCIVTISLGNTCQPVLLKYLCHHFTTSYRTIPTSLERKLAFPEQLRPVLVVSHHDWKSPTLCPQRWFHHRRTSQEYSKKDVRRNLQGSYSHR